ncbi:MAG: bifunctional UDP-4-keto-pentose/UDP-xylose synthase [Candidatus Paracaedibacteraceae bacterium]|nr:bifunctional UDP-4-keto-pentose/UDP-xylose synthase [Candidatus Paracaedibacteraceae bacterium]
MVKKVLILGVNGFIGSALTESILKNTDWEIYGMDMSDHKITEFLGHKNFHFIEGDITINKEWIEYHVKKCDVVLPLVAIANPALYVSDPLRVFELDFEANLSIVRQCVEYKKRVIFPSTSEVYGMSADEEFNEETTSLVLGPIEKQRWIYSCSKQLMDRVIYAYGVQRGLDFTLFRPFNWTGPKLDNIFAAKEGSSRVVTQFIADILHHQRIKLVDGGNQRRSFTDIDDGIAALMHIIENKDNKASGQIFNIGNPDNDISIRELATLILDLVKTYPAYKEIADRVTIEDVTSGDHYGRYYQDIQRRVPSIDNIKNVLGWSPTVTVKEALRKTLNYHLARPSAELNQQETY